jgi:hypothetical protein
MWPLLMVPPLDTDAAVTAPDAVNEPTAPLDADSVAAVTTPAELSEPAVTPPATDRLLAVTAPDAVNEPTAALLAFSAVTDAELRSALAAVSSGVTMKDADSAPANANQ